MACPFLVRFVLSGILCSHLSGVTGKQVTISNTNYRHNTTGDIMDAHDGTYNQWTPGGPWYYYAMGYGTCKQGQDMCNHHPACGYGYSWIGVWKSADMSDGSWTLVREARDDSWPKVVYFRVHTIYNPKTKLYIMWANMNNGPADYAVGTSKSPEGPFTYVHGINIGRKSGGDFDILVDDDGGAYIIYTATQLGHTMAVERLTDDYLSSAAASASTTSSQQLLLPITAAADPSNVSSGVIGNEFVEAPSFFKRKGVYYALFGNCCCFCGHGSGIGVYTATHPLGPYTYHNNVGCDAKTSLTPGCGCGMNHNLADGKKCSFYGQSLTKAQQNYVIRIPQADGSTQLVWTGDRWQSAKDGVKAHDLQYWSVLQFKTVGGLDLPVQFEWEDQIQISVLEAAQDHITV